MSVLLVDWSPIGFRLAKVEGDEIVRLHHEFPGRGEARLGAVYRARVVANEPRLGGVFCTLDGAGTQGFLPVKGRPPSLGSTLLVGVRREAIGDKACQLVQDPSLRLPGATVRRGRDELEVAPGPLPVPGDQAASVAGQARIVAEGLSAEDLGEVAALPPLLRAVTSLLDRSVEAVEVTDPAAIGPLRPWLEPLGVPVAPVRGDAAALRDLLDETEQAALDRIVPLPRGGRLVFDEAEALTAIDVDTGGRDARSAKGAQAGAVAAMLSVLGRQAALRSLGGQLVLDVPRRAFESPKILRDRVTKALAPIGRVSIPAVTVEGVVVVIAPRSTPSLLDRLTETGADGVRPERRLRADAVALRALHGLEAALVRDRSQRVTLACPRRAVPYVERSREALAGRYGERFDVVAEEGEPHVR